MMFASAEQPPEKLEALVEEFADLEPRERLESLLDFARQLPPLPERYAHLRDAGEHRVHECQTPVWVWVEVRDGRVAVFGDAAEESPTVRGFVAILASSLSGATLAEVAAVGNDLLQRMGLIDVLGMMRMRGLHAILHRIRQETRRQAAA